MEAVDRLAHVQAVKARRGGRKSVGQRADRGVLCLCASGAREGGQVQFEVRNTGWETSLCGQASQRALRILTARRRDHECVRVLASTDLRYALRVHSTWCLLELLSLLLLTRAWRVPSE